MERGSRVSSLQVGLRLFSRYSDLTLVNRLDILLGSSSGAGGSDNSRTNGKSVREGIGWAWKASRLTVGGSGRGWEGSAFKDCSVLVGNCSVQDVSILLSQHDKHSYRYDGHDSIC